MIVSQHVPPISPVSGGTCALHAVCLGSFCQETCTLRQAWLHLDGVCSLKCPSRMTANCCTSEAANKGNCGPDFAIVPRQIAHKTCHQNLCLLPCKLTLGFTLALDCGRSVSQPTQE